MPIDNENLDTVETEEQADALLEAIDAPTDSSIQETKPQPQTIDEFELTVGGKAIKAKREQVMQWAQMGYDAPNKIRKLTQDLDGWQKKYSEAEPKWKEMESKYGPVDQYVRQNPQFWDHVVKQYEQRNQILNDQGNPLASMVSDLQKQVQDLVQYKSQIENQQSQARMAQEDSTYMNVLEETKKAYPDIDFITPDDQGKTLEYKILEHAQSKKIGDFQTAFRDFYHDELIKRAEGKAKESLVKDKQKNTKLGILGVSPSPTRRTTSDHRNKSYDDLAREALEELGVR